MEHEIVWDLLPLYHDGVCSEKSRAAVEEHLTACAACRAALAAMDTPLPETEVAAADDAAAVRQLSGAWKRGRRRAWWKGAAIAAAVCAVLVGAGLAAESETVYTFTSYHSAGFEHLEQQADGQWRRLTVSPPPPEEFTDFAPLEFALGGGESHGLGGSLVQKYAGYGTRLCPGLYRLVLEMTAPDGTPHYLAAEFSVD